MGAPLPALPPKPGDEPTQATPAGPVYATGELERALSSSFREVKRPTAGILFTSGAPSAALADVAKRVAQHWPGVPTIIVPAAGVLTDEGELEGVSAAAGMLWSGGRAHLVTEEIAGDDVESANHRFAERLSSLERTAGATGLLFVGAEGFEPSMLHRLADALPSSQLVGGGSVLPTVAAVAADGAARLCGMAALVVGGLGAPVVDVSPAARMLSDFAPIGHVDGGMVLTIGGEPALDRLSSCASKVRRSSGRPLIFAALAEQSPEADQSDPRYILRPLRGIDPSRRGVLVGDEAMMNRPMAFAVRDGEAARKEIEIMARRVGRGAQGAMPRFAFYFNCAGRGEDLYGADSVDVRVLRRHFPNVPIVGMQSSFEIVPWGPGSAQLQMFSGVFALFRSLS